MPERTTVAAVERAYERMRAGSTSGVLIDVIDESRALAAAHRVDRDIARGAMRPLAGQTMVVKANIDVAGHRTTAACPTFGSVAATSAAVVRNLESAGAVAVAITNMDQFATGLVGTRSPYGICPNAHWPHLIAGGSSSGSAVAVARGWADLGIGTDTAGSGRVPAAANGIVGMKPTRGWLSTTGVVPACRSFDCVSVFANAIDAGARAIAVAGGFDPDDARSRAWPASAAPSRPSHSPLRLGLPADGAPPAVGDLARQLDAEIVAVDMTPFLAAGRLLYDGAFVAERYAAVGNFIEGHREDVDPIVADIIMQGGQIPAWRFAEDIETLARLRRATSATWSSIDALVVPTVERLPTVDEVMANPIDANSALGTFTTFVNVLDLCSVTLPVGLATATAPPPSVTIVGPAWTDDRLVQISRCC